MSMYPPVRDEMIRLLSTPRLGTYANACEGSIPRGLDLYRWNLDVSVAFFESIHFFEVALRNAMHTAMDRWFSDRHVQKPVDTKIAWFDPEQQCHEGRTAAACAGLGKGSIKIVGRAYTSARQHYGKTEPDQVVAELTLGFWQFLLRDTGGDSMWSVALQHSFVEGAKQKRLADSVLRIATLRNRIAHHEPIFNLNLQAEYVNLIAAAEKIAPRLGWWIDSTSRVEQVLKSRPASAC